MLRLLVVLILLQNSCVSFSQNLQNSNWVLGTPGHGTLLEFKDSLTLTWCQPALYLTGSNAIISDSTGKLLFYTNSCWVANSEHKIMKNGDSLNLNLYKYGLCKQFYGDPTPGCVITEYPGNPKFYYLFNIDIDIPFFGIDSLMGARPQRLLYNVINMQKDSGRGELVLKNQIAFYDTLGNSSIAVCRHNNKHDFWLIVPKAHSNCYFVFLINDKGIQPPIKECLGERWSDFDTQGQSTFSPDGKLYARINKNNGLNIYEFDSESGILSNPKPRILFPSDSFYFAGLSFSPNSRYLYASIMLKVIQFDLKSNNIGNSKITVGVYDGFKNPESTIFTQAALAPDGRIYITPYNTTSNLHIISKPDCPGTSSELKQHDLLLKSWNINSVP